MAQGIEHYWGLREWAHLRRYPLLYDARCVALLTPEQLRRAQEPGRLPISALAPTQQQGILRLQLAKQEVTEREGGPPSGSPALRPEQLAKLHVALTYVPAGWHLAFVIPEYVHVRPWDGPWDYSAGRTAAEATAAARQLYAGASSEEVHYARDGFFRMDLDILLRP
jgi:hypothetical protein